MRLIFAVVMVSVLLALNYFTGWRYDVLPENRAGSKDSVRVMTSHRYARMTPLKWLLMGTNYRKEWSMPVTIPVFHLHTEKGGFKLGRLGGGEQTKSLHLTDSSGAKWVLRTVDKEVRDAIPFSVRNSFFIPIVQDQISAAFPFAPLTVTVLSVAAGIPSTPSELFFVPDDTALGFCRHIMRDQVCFLEKEAPALVTKGMINTLALRKKLADNDSCRVLQGRVLKARLLDMLIADWDRHDRQWDWSWLDSAGMHYFYPIPEDRDQAYFYSEGLFPNLVRVIGMPQLIGFRNNTKDIRKLNFKAQVFDRFFLDQLGESDWRRTITEFCSEITDDVIHRAIAKLPAEIYALSGEELEWKLRERRNGLLVDGMGYYKFLASSGAPVPQAVFQ